jgi:hypothetical protein
MEPLIFKIETQADDSGVRQYDKSLSGLDVSSKKASGALKNFVQDISQAKDGADIASSALGAFGKILGSSLAGTAVIMAGKTLIDSFNRIDQAVKDSEKAVAEAFAGMDKAGKALSFAEATTQAKNLESVAETIRRKIKEINESPLDSLIDAITQSTVAMDINATLVENQAKEIKRLGAESELVHLQKMQGLDAENKALELNSRALAKELEGISAIDESETALAVTRKYQLQADEIRAKFADDRHKAEVENASTRQKEIDARIQKERELGQVQQKRFEDLYNAEIKAQEETQSRIDAHLEAEEELATKLLELYDALDKARNKPPSGGGGGGGGGGGTPGITGDPNQPKTSAEVGAQEAAQRAYIQGLKDSAAELRQYTANQLKANGLASDSDAVNRKLKQTAVDLAYEQGRAKYGIEDFIDGIRTAEQNLADFKESAQDASKSTSEFSSSMEEIFPAFDKTVKSAENFSDSITENTGDLVKDFLKTGDGATDIGKDFNQLGVASEDLSDKLNKASKAAEVKERRVDNTEKVLGDIHTLLESNLQEMRTYAFVK